MRNKLALFCYRRGLHRLGCFIRGFHSGMGSLGRCVACGKSQPHLMHYAAPVTNYANLPETIAQRNDRIRSEARLYGL